MEEPAKKSFSWLHLAPMAYRIRLFSDLPRDRERSLGAGGGEKSGAERGKVGTKSTLGGTRGSSQ
jgi:hypothetical protein